MDNPRCVIPSSTTCTTFLTPGQILGLGFTAETGLLSVVAVLILFYMIIRNVLRNNRRASEDKRSLFMSPLDVYMLSLFISDLIQGIGISLNIRWVAQGTVRCGSYCTVQGILQQLGETGVALSTLAIAVHTFITIFFRKFSQGVLIPTLVTCVLWFYTVLVAAISAGVHTKGKKYFYTPTPYWCWVGSRYLGEKIVGEYFWLWLTGLVSLVLYLLIFLCLRGNVEREGKGLGFRFRRRPKFDTLAPDLPATSLDKSLANDAPRDSTDAAKKAFEMLLYPAAYVALILPLSIGRWIGFVREARHPQDPNDIHSNISPAATFVIISIFGLSGVVNVILILLTRPGLLLLSEPKQSPALGPFFGSSESVALPAIRSPESLRQRWNVSDSSTPDVSQRPHDSMTTTPA